MHKNLFDCRGKIAVVTGGSGLIGREVVRGLASFGAKAYSADLQSCVVPERKNKIKQIYLDITSESSVKSVFKKIKEDEGRIDILVNCAYPRTEDWGLPFEAIPFSSWKKNVNDQLGGYFLSCQAVAEIMKKQKNGSIINMASIYGVAAPDFSIYQGVKMTMPAAYSAIKGGVIVFTRYLAAYYAKYNIKVNSISPGGVFNRQDSVFVKRYAQKTPLGRMAKPSDVVGAAIYLASDASEYVTGINLLVDGGWTAW